MTKQAHIFQDSSDDHVFIVISCPERPTISIDITNGHGRRNLSVRVDGMGIMNVLLDVKELKTKGEGMFRFCSMCGEKLNLYLSSTHKCLPIDDD